MSRFPEVGERLRRTRRERHMTTEQVASHTGMSRALLYRYECGDIVKLDTLGRLADLYGTSTNALLGMGSEYIRHGVVFFDRLLKLEEVATDITCVFGPIAYLLTSDEYDAALWDNLVAASANPGSPGISSAQADHLMYVLRKRKQTFARVKPRFTSIVPIGDVKRYLQFGWSEQPDSPALQAKRSRTQACREMRHMLQLLDAPSPDVRVGLTDSPLTTGGFSSLTLPERRVAVTSPFRLSAPINVQFGVATISEDEESVRGHDGLADHIWQSALKGPAAVDRLNALIQEYGQAS